MNLIVKGFNAALVKKSLIRRHIKPQDSILPLNEPCPCNRCLLFGEFCKRESARINERKRMEIQ
jgi:hypothetical protein